MRFFFNYINDRVLYKTANLNLTSISIKILTGLITSKVIAVLIGAEGMALIGNLRNFTTAIQSFSISGLYKGTVKYISRFKEDSSMLSATLSTTFFVGFFSTMTMAICCYYNAEAISRFLFSGAYRYTHIIELMALVLPFYALNMFTFSIMNGFSKYKILLIMTIIGQILGLLVTLVLIWQDNIDGALMAIVITPALVFLITLVGILFRKSLVNSIKIENIDFGLLKLLSPYAIMALLTSIAIPLVLILIRNYIIAEIGLKEAGYWQAMNRISDYYLMFVNSLITLYILPRLSEISKPKAFRSEIFKFYTSVMPYFALVLVVIFLLRSWIVPALLSEEFKTTESLFAWQLTGDFIKVLAMVIAFQFLAKKMFTHFIILQVFLFVILYFSSLYFIDVFGLRGAVIGHCFSYFMYFAIVLLLFASSLFGVIPDKIED